MQNSGYINVLYSIKINNSNLQGHKNKCHTWPFLVCFYSICFLFTVFSILELRCLDTVLVVHLPSLHCAFSIFTTFGIPHLELCCLDSMFLVSFTVFEFSIPILELCCLDSMFLFLFTVCAFWIMELCCLDFMILVLLTTFAFCILELCCLDSMFLLSITVFKFYISHSGIMLPRFYVPFFTVCAFWNYVASIPWSLII